MSKPMNSEVYDVKGIFYTFCVMHYSVHWTRLRAICICKAELFLVWRTSTDLFLYTGKCKLFQLKLPTWFTTGIAAESPKCPRR